MRCDLQLDFVYLILPKLSADLLMSSTIYLAHLCCFNYPKTTNYSSLIITLYRLPAIIFNFRYLLQAPIPTALAISIIAFTIIIRFTAMTMTTVTVIIRLYYYP